ncbi:MAG TPA: hypothetical protein VL793_16635, partial [Patescibacteria group bacterium]|nr:hypothetical protein [Patescibacteria group bacterium]
LGNRRPITVYNSGGLEQASGGHIGLVEAKCCSSCSEILSGRTAARAPLLIRPEAEEGEE